METEYILQLFERLRAISVHGSRRDGGPSNGVVAASYPPYYVIDATVSTVDEEWPGTKHLGRFENYHSAVRHAEQVKAGLVAQWLAHHESKVHEQRLLITKLCRALPSGNDVRINAWNYLERTQNIANILR